MVQNITKSAITNFLDENKKRVFCENETVVGKFSLDNWYSTTFYFKIRKNEENIVQNDFLQQQYIL